MKIAVVDYGMGNLRSVEKALERTGARVEVTSEAGRIDAVGRPFDERLRPRRDRRQRREVDAEQEPEAPGRDERRLADRLPRRPEVSDEAVRRQEALILLGKALTEARRAEAQGDLSAASTKYEEAYNLIQKIGVGVEQETRDTVSGMGTVRLALARQAQRRGRFEEAALHVNRVLAVDPKNEPARKFKTENDKALKALAGRRPSNEIRTQLPEFEKQQLTVGTMLQDGKLLYEMGKLEEAEAKLKEAARLDPNNQASFYYLTLIEEGRYAQGARRRGQCGDWRRADRRDSAIRLPRGCRPGTSREHTGDETTRGGPCAASCASFEARGGR